MSERVSWESCPTCQRLAAVGWLDGRAVEVDCPNGCSVSPVEVVSVFRLDRLPGPHAWGASEPGAWHP